MLHGLTPCHLLSSLRAAFGDFPSTSCCRWYVREEINSRHALDGIAADLLRQVDSNGFVWPDNTGFFDPADQTSLA